MVPRRWKVIETVRERFSCRDCETITQPPAPFHVTPRGFAGQGKTVTGRIWTYVRDDRPFGSRAPPAALYYASRDRAGAHPERHLHGFSGILQADAYAGILLGACTPAVL